MPRTRRELKTYPINVRQLVVSRVQDVSAGMRRITLTGDQLRAFTTADGIAVPPLRNEGFDDHVKLIVPGPGQDRPIPPVQVEGHLDWWPPAGRPTAKDYTPRRWDPEAGELDLDLVRHGSGFASRWAEHVQPGDPAYIAGPKASALLPDGVDWYLVAGDETALPAIGRLLDELPPGSRAQVFVEVEDATHEVPLTAGPGVEITWLHRHGAPAGTTDLLERAIRDADWWDGEVYAWVAAEALTLKPIRAHLKHDRSVPRDCLDITGYWRRTVGSEAAEPGAATDGVDDPQAAAATQLARLLDSTGPAALRAAVSVGLVARLDRGPAPVEVLAAELGLADAPLRALVRYLAAVDVVVLDDGDPAATGTAPVRLGPVGELVADEDTLAALDLGGARALLELSPADLVTVLRTGAAAPRSPGRLVTDLLAGDQARAAEHRAFRGGSATWSSPSIASHHDWSTYREITALGAGAPETVSTVLHENVNLRATLVDLPSVLPGAEAAVEASVRPRVDVRAQSPLAPLTGAAGDAVLVVHLLDQLADPDAAHLLGALQEQLGDADLVVAELVLEPDEATHDHDAEIDLKLWSAFGSGVRTPSAYEALFGAAGLHPVTPRGGQELGWDMRLWVLRAAPDR
ncbi:NADPH-dependent ferric siderophore reductase [Mumia flava]|uniref:NADPH-dependent ferric siderophore reductase n=1 Tax=Mumia flava TaxID=1348852 RepID=A0A0B2BDU2_9ACTN|nr:siderophore-interacting protein [Mumia flava]PJJ53724.1 NADPH-dependent ferric siderophore reductase [Mumia flava]